MLRRGKMPEKLKKVYSACMKSGWAAKQAKKTGKSKDQICRATAVKATGQKWERHKKSLEIELKEDLIVDLSLRITEAELSDTGTLLVKGIGVTEDFMNLEDMIIYHKDAIGSKVLFDHLHPVKGIKIKGVERRFPVFGYVEDADLISLGETVGVELTLRIMGFSKAHKKLQEMILSRLENKDPLGLSAHYIRYFGEDKEQTLHLHWEEFSVTPHPVCPICLTSEANKYSELPTQGDMNMSTENITAATVEAIAQEVVAEEQATLSDGTDGETKTPAGAETPVDTLETLKGTIVEMNSVVEAQKNKLAELEALIQTRDGTITELSEKLSLGSEEISFLKEKKPLLNKIEKKLGARYTENETLKEHYAKLPIEILKAEVARLSEAEEAIKEVPVENDPTPAEQKPDDTKLEELFPGLNKMIEDSKRDSVQFIQKA